MHLLPFYIMDPFILVIYELHIASYADTITLFACLQEIEMYL